MPWKKNRGIEGTTKNKENGQGRVDQLPLVTSSENTDSAIASADSESKSENSSVTTHKENSQTPKRHVTTVTISHCDDDFAYVQQRHSTPNNQLPIISYEKNKSVRIIVKESDSEAVLEPSKRKSRYKEGESENAYSRESVSEKSKDVNDWIENHRKAITHQTTSSRSPEKHKDEEGIKVRPLLEASWRGSSHTSVLDEPPSSDDCQRSTSTLVNTSISKIGKSGNECQRGFVSVLCGISIIVGSAVFLRLPALLLTYGPGSFLLAFGLSLFVVAVPLAFLECGLAQFSNNSVIGVWSLVPLFRGIGWSTVVGCLYWGAITAGLAAPWFHYVIAQNDPEILQIPNLCKLLNGSEFDSVTYYRHCVYNLSSDWDKGADITLTWSLPTGLITILMIASLSVTGGPSLLAFISASGSFVAIIGHGIQFYVSLYEIRGNEKYGLKDDLKPLLKLLIPDPETLIEPQLWLAAMSQALLCLGPGVGMLLNHSANNVFRHPLRRHLCLLITITVITTISVTLTTLFESKIFAAHYTSPNSDVTLSEATPSLRPEFHSPGNGSSANNYYTTLPVKNCILYTYSLTDFSCKKIPSGLIKGVPFILSSHLVSFAMVKFPSWLASAFKNLIFIGFLGAGIATCSVCMHVGVVAAREARSIPPAAAALILMAVLSLVAAPMTTQAGASFIHLVDHFVLTPGLMWPSIATLIGLTACHGMAKIRKDMTFMLESTVSLFWLPIWAGVIPLLLLVITVGTFVTDWEEMGFIKEPGWCLSIVWSLRLGLLISIPITAVIVINSQLAYGFKDKVLSSLQSSREWGDWGPQDPIEHHNWRRWREDETRSYASLERRLASKSRPLTYTHSTLSSSSSSTLGRLRAKYRSQAKPSDI